jgi:hypothetical protein
MDSFSKYLQNIADELKTLQGDVEKIAVIKAKEIKENKPEEDTAQSPKDKFKKIPLKSMQRVTKLYKSKEEILKAQENPEMDFINKKIEEIFRG